MKKSLLGFVALAAMLGATSCSQEDVALKTGESHVSFNVGVNNEVLTRNISNGEGANKLMYQVFQEGSPYGNVETVEVTEWSTKVEFDINAGEYQVVFWAQNADCEAYTFGDNNLSTLTVSYEDALNNDETRDAFYTVQDISVVAGQTNTYDDVVLKRPFAQVNVGMTSEQLGGNTISESSMQVTGLNNSMNLLSGVTTGAATTGSVLFNKAAVVNEDLTVSGETYEWLSMSYVLPGDNVTLAFEFEGTSQNYTLNLSDVPVKANTRTNILGNILTGKVEITVDMDPAFEVDDINKEGELEEGEENGQPTPEETISVSNVQAEVSGDNVIFSATYTGTAKLESAEFVCTPVTREAAKTFTAQISGNELTAKVPTSELTAGNYTVTVNVNGEAATTQGETAAPSITIPEAQQPDQPAGNVYQLVTTAPSDWAGEYVLAYVNTSANPQTCVVANALNATTGNTFITQTSATDFNSSANTISGDYNLITLEKLGNYYTIKFQGYYIGWKAGGKNTVNPMTTAPTTSDTGYLWTISIENNLVKFVCALQDGSTDRVLQYNTQSGSERFACYTSTQKSVNLFAPVK